MNIYAYALKANFILTVALTAWLAAQILKTIINFIIGGKFNAERLFGSGGMPSSHSALVCAMTVATCRLMGANSPLFAVTVLLACIVMYDAMGVRRETGKQAKILNKIIFGWLSDDDPENDDIVEPDFKKLKELVGHTPFEVIGGAILGIVLGLIIPIIK